VVTWNDESHRCCTDGSIRCPNTHDLVLRVLTVFTNNDQTLVVCIGGDKAAWQRTKRSDWYEHAIPVADQIFDIYQQHPF
jgi:hypothetical protein